MLTTQQVRMLVLKCGPEILTHSPDSPSLDLKVTSQIVSKKALKEGLITQEFGHNALMEFEQVVFDVVWELILEGVFAPGRNPENYGCNLPFFRVTAHGKNCLKTGAFTPHDPKNYLQQLASDNPTLTELSKMYLGEALETFRARNYLATAVMVGVASETILIDLTEAVHKALDTTPKQDKFADDLKKGRYTASCRHQQILAPLRANMSETLLDR